jgi:hypothetical protein
MPEMNREARGGRAPLPGNGNSPAPPAAPAASGDAGSDHTQGTAAEGSGGQHAADETSAVTGDTGLQGKNATLPLIQQENRRQRRGLPL